MVRFYCDACDEHREVIIERLQKDDLNGDMIWGDIVCKECHLVIATISADAPGVYEFKKVEPDVSA